METTYKEFTEVAIQEKNSNARPKFKNAEALDLSKYDTILRGYPIWWGDVSMIINTFLEKYDFSGKTIIPFNTHEGFGDAGTYAYIKNKMTSSNVNTNGLAIRDATLRFTVKYVIIKAYGKMAIDSSLIVETSIV